ncbi:hypothetical protein Tco_1517271 [Tanacetum coccineum]
MSGSDADAPPPPPPPPSQTPTQQTPHTVSTIKLHILIKGEYDIWAMKMEHYLAHADYPIWEVIQRRNGLVSVSTDTNGLIKVLPPKTAEETLAREREGKARTTLLMALPEDHLAKFHKMTDAKEMWEAIKSRFGGNDESKKMQKYILKQQFEGFSVSNLEGLHKGFDRSLPSAWSQISLIMRAKPGVDTISFDDLYNNIKVFESDVKGSTTSSSSTQNVAFISENNSSTNDLDEYLEEIDLKWQVAMISMRIKSSTKRQTGHFAKECRTKGNQDSKRRDAWNSGNKDKENGRRTGKQEDSKALVQKQRYEGILSYENEVLQSVFMNKESDLEKQPLYDSDETHESLLEQAVNEPKVVSQPKVWFDAPIIKEYDSDSEDEHVSLPIEEQETPSFAIKQVKTPRETVKNQFTHSKNPKVNKKGMGYRFTTKACFVCGSLSHLIEEL